MNKEFILMLREVEKKRIEVINLELQIQDIEEDRELRSLAAISYTERTGQTNKISSITESKALELVDKVTILKGRKRALERLIARVDNAMSLLDETEKDLIDMKCIKNMRYWQIEEHMKRKNKEMSERHIIRVLDKALKTIEDILKR